MHRTRLTLGTWFGAVESLVLYRSSGIKNHMPAQALATQLSIEYVAARRLRTLIVTDIQWGGAGIFRTALCINSLNLPENTKLNSFGHLAWLLEQVHLTNGNDG